MEIQKVTSNEIIDEVKKRIANGESITESELKETVGALNGMDMKMYMIGYIDALRQLRDYFKTRV